MQACSTGCPAGTAMITESLKHRAGQVLKRKQLADSIRLTADVGVALVAKDCSLPARSVAVFGQP